MPNWKWAMAIVVGCGVVVLSRLSPNSRVARGPCAPRSATAAPPAATPRPGSADVAGGATFGRLAACG